MPLYRFACPNCDILIEELRPMRFRDGNVECPVCHSLCVPEIAQVNVIGQAKEPEAAPDEAAPHPFDPTCSCCLRRAAS